MTMKGEKKCKLFVFKTCCAYELSNVKKVSNIRMVKKGNKRKFTGEKKIMKSKLNKIYQKKMDANKIYIKKILHIFFFALYHHHFQQQQQQCRLASNLNSQEKKNQILKIAIKKRKQRENNE